MTREEKVSVLTELLDKHYPLDTKCYLNYSNPYELMIATILSAQCTDDRVNEVTKALFKKYPTVDAFADADLSELEQDVKSTGFFRTKAKSIIEAMKRLRELYNYDLPSDIDELTEFAGVGRKTANVVRGHVFGIPSIVVDTHVKRLSYKLGLTENTDPVKIEFDLMRALPEKSWIPYNTQIIAHGRKVCTARSPKCESCFLREICILPRSY